MNMVKDKLTNRSFGGWGFGGSLSRLFFSPLGSSAGASSSSPFSLGFALASVFSSDSPSFVLDDVFVLSLFILSKWRVGYFQVRGTTSSVRLR